MAKTKKKKMIKNNTIKNKKKLPILKILDKNFTIYGAKPKTMGANILDYTAKMEKTHKTHCVYENISWFAELEQAKHYKGKNDEIFKWKIKKTLKLITINEQNETFFRKLFLNTTKNIRPAIQIHKKHLTKITVEHVYLQMNDSEKALYEFNFIFGYLTLKEQFEFLIFIKYLITNEFIEILSRHNTNLLPKINKKIHFYNLYPFGKKDKLNRISLYEINKQAMLNLCNLSYNKYNIDGVYQPNTNSFWYPDLIVYHMNIEEFILFSPHTELENNGIV